MDSAQLSMSDCKVLEQIFDPESGPASTHIVVNPSLPADRRIGSATLLQQLKSTERRAIGLIEEFETSRDQTPQTKDNAYRAALSILDEMIAWWPDYASARNNRAQLYRWQFGDRNVIVQPRARVDVPCQRPNARQALFDLEHAISLSSPERQESAVSQAQGKVLAQAYTQLGTLYLAAGRDLEAPQAQPVELVDKAYTGFSKEHFEEEASRLFHLGGVYGSEVAKAMAVHTNPHAKLCGAIVQEAMRKELRQVHA